MASALELMARTVAYLRNGPATDKEICKAIRCKRETGPRHTEMLRREGVIYVASWTAERRPQPVWAMQPVDEPMPDAPCGYVVGHSPRASVARPANAHRHAATAALIATRPNLRTKWVGQMAEVFKREPQEA